MMKRLVSIIISLSIVLAMVGQAWADEVSLPTDLSVEVTTEEETPVDVEEPKEEIEDYYEQTDESTDVITGVEDPAMPDEDQEITSDIQETLQDSMNTTEHEEGYTNNVNAESKGFEMDSFGTSIDLVKVRRIEETNDVDWDLAMKKTPFAWSVFGAASSEETDGIGEAVIYDAREVEYLIEVSNKGSIDTYNRLIIYSKFPDDTVFGDNLFVFEPDSFSAVYSGCKDSEAKNDRTNLILANTTDERAELYPAYQLSPNEKIIVTFKMRCLTKAGTALHNLRVQEEVIQTHNAEDAMLSVWGVHGSVDANTGKLLIKGGTYPQGRYFSAAVSVSLDTQITTPGGALSIQYVTEQEDAKPLPVKVDLVYPYEQTFNLYTEEEKEEALQPNEIMTIEKLPEGTTFEISADPGPESTVQIEPQSGSIPGDSEVTFIQIKEIVQGFGNLRISKKVFSEDQPAEEDGFGSIIIAKKVDGSDGTDEMGAPITPYSIVDPYPVIHRRCFPVTVKLFNKDGTAYMDPCTIQYAMIAGYDENGEFYIMPESEYENAPWIEFPDKFVSGGYSLSLTKDQIYKISDIPAGVTYCVTEDGVNNGTVVIDEVSYTPTYSHRTGTVHPESTDVVTITNRVVDDVVDVIQEGEDGIDDKYQITVSYEVENGRASFYSTVLTKYDADGNMSETGVAIVEAKDVPDTWPDSDDLTDNG